MTPDPLIRLKYVPQQTGVDCGVATLAMLAGVTYKAALRLLSKKARDKIAAGIGINHCELEAALRKCGFVAFIALHESYANGERRRGVWPPEPVGFRHVVSSQNPEGTHHFSAMDVNGRVFDPSNPSVADLSAFHKVNEVTLIVRPTKAFAA